MRATAFVPSVFKHLLYLFHLLNAKQVVGDAWLLWFTYLLILVAGNGPFPTVINEARGEKNEMALSQLCAYNSKILFIMCPASLLNSSLLPYLFPMPLTLFETKVIDVSANNLKCLIPGLMFVFTHSSLVNSMSSWNTFLLVDLRLGVSCFCESNQSLLFNHFLRY